MAFQFFNSPTTTLAAALNAGVLTGTLTSASGLPATGNFPVKIDNEIALCTARTGAVLTLTRGTENTTDANHSNGATVTFPLTAAAFARPVFTTLTVNQVGLTSGTELSILLGAGKKLTQAAGNYSWFLDDLDGVVQANFNGVVINLDVSGGGTLDWDSSALPGAGAAFTLGAAGRFIVSINGHDVINLADPKPTLTGNWTTSPATVGKALAQLLQGLLLMTDNSTT